MMLLAKRVSANLPPENRTSTSSALESFLMRSKISAAWSLVSIQLLSAFLCASVSLCLCGELAAFVSAPDFDAPKPRWRRSMTCAHHLLRLALAAIRRAPECPLVAGADCVQR